MDDQARLERNGVPRMTIPIGEELKPLIKNTLIVPYWFYVAIAAGKFQVLAEKYCRDTDLIYVDDKGRPISFKRITSLEPEGE